MTSFSPPQKAHLDYKVYLYCVILVNIYSWEHLQCIHSGQDFTNLLQFMTDRDCIFHKLLFTHSWVVNNYNQVEGDGWNRGGGCKIFGELGWGRAQQFWRFTGGATNTFCVTLPQICVDINVNNTAIGVRCEIFHAFKKGGGIQSLPSQNISTFLPTFIVNNSLILRFMKPSNTVLRNYILWYSLFRTQLTC